MSKVRVALVVCQSMWCEALDWVLEHKDFFGISAREDVELITLAGAHRVLATNHSAAQEDLLPEIFWRINTVAIGGHYCRAVVVAGHDHCLGTPGNTEDHRKMVNDAVSKIRCWNGHVRVVGLLFAQKEDDTHEAKIVYMPEKLGISR